MIKGFRKLRHQNLKPKGLGLYLPYVIAEIILVVAGILIALRINNWNETRKERALEVKLLSELKDDIQQNRTDFQYNIDLREQSITSIYHILEAIENSTPFHDTLSFHFGNMANTSIMTINNSSFESIKSVGLAVITDDVLRNSITNFYEVSIDYLDRIEREYEARQITPRWTDFLLRNFHNSIPGESATPNDFPAMMQSPFFKELLNLSLHTHQQIKETYEAMDYQASTIFSLIDLELNPE